MKVARQTTLRDHTELCGVGVHSGLPVTLTLHPADADTGLRFIRTRLDGWQEREILADMSAVTATEFATVLGDASGPLVSTAEHVLAALSGLGVDNAVVEIDGPEAPIMDGSAAPFVAAIDAVGLETLDRPRRYIKVLKREIARARTFGFLRDVASLWNAGYALGASLENTLVVSDNRILNPEGTRFPDEFVRHKILDAVGDLALAGAPLLGTYRSVRGGHKLNHALLCALMADASAWTWVDGEMPRPIIGHAEIASRLTPAFGPDRS
jgi:UDP-3-O-[3-hydroxymyristoyl] N-acetylglucosamine deacetylase